MSWLRISCLVDGVGAGGFFLGGVPFGGFFCGGGVLGGALRGGLCLGGVGFVVAGGRRGGVGPRGDIGLLAICRLGLGPFAIRGALRVLA